MAETKVQESQVEDLVRSGEFKFPSGQRINVINPSGETVSLPSEEIKDALSAGYRIERAFDGAVRKKVEEESGKTGAALKVFAGQAADEALFGLPELVADKTMSPFNVAVKERLKKEFETANDLGGVTGFLGSLFVGGPLFKGAAKAGQAASKAVAGRLAEAGVKRGSESLAKDIVARAAENAASLGIEGLAVSAPRAVTEAALGDPEAAAESLLVGGGIGVALGTLAGPTGALFSRLNKKVSERIKNKFGEKAQTIGEDAGERIMPDPNAVPDDSIIQTMQSGGVGEGMLETVRKEVSKVKPHAAQIQKDAADLGIKPLEEMLSDSKFVQDLGSALAQRPTIAGISRSKRYQEIFDGLETATKGALGMDDFERSAFEVGQEVRTSVFGKAKEARDKLGTVFNELRIGYQDIPMDQRALKQVAGNIDALGRDAISPSAEAVFKRISKQIKEGRISDLNKLKEVRTLLYDMYGADKSVNKAVSEVVKKLNLQEERQIERAIKSRIEAARSAPGEATLQEASRIQGLFDDMQAAKRSWAEMASFMEEAGDALGMGHIRNPGDFIARGERLTNEEIVRRMIPKDDVASMRFLQKNFPDQFQIVSSLKKQQLLSDVIKDNKIQNWGAFFRKVNSMPKEMQESIFGPQGVETLKKVRNVFEAVPKNVNPSGTAKTTAMFEMLNPMNLPGTVLANASDFAQSGALKAMSIEGILGVESRMADIGRRIQKIDSSIFKSGKSRSIGKPLSLINTILGENETDAARAIEKLQDKVSEIAADPLSATTRVSELTSGLSESGAPGVAMAFGQNLVRTMSYIQQSIPKRTAISNPLVKIPYRPTDAEMSAFERKLAVIDDPFVAIDALQAGTLTKDHVESLSVNYPQIYASMREKVFDLVSENKETVPFSQRMKLSLLLGVDLDQAINPSILASLQVGSQLQAEVQAQADAQESSGLRQSGLNKMKQHQSFETQSQRLLARN